MQVPEHPEPTHPNEPSARLEAGTDETPLLSAATSAWAPVDQDGTDPSEGAPGPEATRAEWEAGPPADRPWALDLYLAGMIIAAFAVDQTTKWWIRGNLTLGESIPGEGFFRLTRTYNTGSAFGLFPNQTFLLMLASMAGIAILIIFFRNQPIPPVWLRTSLGLQLGGAAGNLVDRITLGRVTDFLDVGPWPVFNMADSSIVVGIVILAWFLLRAPSAPRTQPEQVSDDTPQGLHDSEAGVVFEAHPPSRQSDAGE